MRALVLCSSGARTAYIAGAAFSMLRDLGLKYDVIAGFGMAATAAAHLVQEGQAHVVEQAFSLLTSWTTLRPDTPKVMPFGALASVLRADRYSAGPWVRFYDRLCPEAIRCSDVYLVVGGWSVQSDEFLEYSRTSPYLLEAIKAACGSPVVEFPPVEADFDHAPLREVMHLDCRLVDVVIDRPLGAEPELAAHPEAFEIAHAFCSSKLNDLVADDIEAYRQAARFRVLRPSEELTKDPLSSDPFVTRRMIKRGQEEALARFSCR